MASSNPQRIQQALEQRGSGSETLVFDPATGKLMAKPVQDIRNQASDRTVMLDMNKAGSGGFFCEQETQSDWAGILRCAPSPWVTDLPSIESKDCTSSFVLFSYISRCTEFSFCLDAYGNEKSLQLDRKRNSEHGTFCILGKLNRFKFTIIDMAVTKTDYTNIG